MKDLFEAVLTINVNANIVEAYKTAIGSESHPNGSRDRQNGNYAYVVIGDQTANYQDNASVDKNAVSLTIQLLSRSLPDSKGTADWYENMGCIVIRIDYREGKPSNQTSLSCPK